MLDVQSLCVNYGNVEALKDISLSVNAGEILVIVGPNGAGKSTLIKAASGMLPFHGRVLVNGRDFSHLNNKERACLLAVVPQARQLPGAFSVSQTVLLGRTPYMNWLGQASSLDRQKALWAMERTGVARLADRRLGELSGGEQQRVLLARALAQDAPLLLLDEPTTHLDLKHQSGLLNLLRKLAQEKNLAVLMILHDLNLAGLYADRIALLVDGQIRSTGTPAEVLISTSLTDAFGVAVQVIRHPDYGTPLVLPDGRGSFNQTVAVTSAHQ